MNTKKSLLAIAVAMGLGFSGATLADPTLGGDGDPNTNANDGSAALNDVANTDIADSGNTDASTNNTATDSFKIKDSGNDNSDNSVDVTDSFKIKDSGNDNSDNSAHVTDSFKIKDSGNDNSDNSTHVTDAFKIANSGNTDDNSDNSTDLDLSLNVFLNNADLDGTVSGTTVTYGSGIGADNDTYAKHYNKISDNSANFTGVGAIAQNNGHGSVNQANVSVQSNLSAGGN
ncbi:dentin sialophosphoprotein [Marinobacter qingdaonensis]|uniref:Dentin sialophosphoprotein n=1 Tax=Marinobacter qingdaonensis TaxID=3108486 RepID=A0ABU5NXX4_9GAMM|nr:dentin sialophosphoprotein [Marinobacter sp. ASW11-75]MEA1080659.1 dentin sialophosphoprotein [Marinobacter sp. ASW11-75]